MVADLIGKVGRLQGQQGPNEHGIVLTIRVLAGSSPREARSQQCTACAMLSDALGLVTDAGSVYAVHLSKQRYTCLDTLSTAGTAAACMARLSRRLFIGCSNGEIHCYDISSSSRLARLPGHRTAVTSLSTKSDTEQLLSASSDAVLLWDMQTYRQRRMLSGAPYGSSHTMFSPAGNLVAAISHNNIRVWNAKTLHELGEFNMPVGQAQQRFSASCCAISPDERWLIVGCQVPAVLLLYNLQSVQLQHALQLPEDMFGISQVHLLPDSTSAAVLTVDGCISFLDTQSGAITGQLQLTFPGCRASSFSTDPRANSMAVVCSDGLLRVYDLSVVRAKQQGLWQTQPVQKLQQSQLQQLPAGTGSLASRQGTTNSCSIGDGSRKHQQQVLSEVQNMPLKQPKVQQKAKPAAAAARQAPGPLHIKPLHAAFAGLQHRKLQEILMVYGEFPARYRSLIWEYLLHLPHNSTAFTLLQNKGMHAAFKNIHQQLCLLGSRSTLAVRLQSCLSQLAHWCPLFGEVGFLPRFTFPFVKLFGTMMETTFEVAATLLLNWCKGWFELFPNAPLPLLRRFLLMLAHHDQELGSHLQSLGLPLLQQLWEQLSGALSDLLPSQQDWLVLWDHCLAAPAGPCFMYKLLASYLIRQRRLLLAVRDEQQLTQLFESRPAVDIQQLVQQAYKLQETTPHYAVVGSITLTPLPSVPAGSASYPAFNEYPVGSIELQEMQRRRIQEAEDALIRRRQVVAELEQRSKQVAFDSAALTAQRQQLAALDAQRRTALHAVEDSLAAATSRLDDAAKGQKLKQIRMVEEAYQASLSSLRAEWSAELAALKADVEHRRRLTAAALKSRQEEEDIKALEFQTQQRLWALQQEELAAAGTSALQDTAAAQAAALAAEQQRKVAEWQAQDEARALCQQHEAARRARLLVAAEQEAAKQAAKGLLLAQELHTQQDLAKVEHARRLRQLAEDQAELTAQQLQLQRERQTVSEAGRQAILQQARTDKARFDHQQQQRLAAVLAERDVLRQKQAGVHLAAAEVGASARLTEAQQKLVELQQALRQADKEHAAKVEQILKQLQQGEVAPDQAATRLDQAQENPDISAAAAANAAAGSPAKANAGVYDWVDIQQASQAAPGAHPPGPTVIITGVLSASHAAAQAAGLSVHAASSDVAVMGSDSRPADSTPSCHTDSEHMAALETQYGQQLNNELQQLVQQQKGSASIAAAHAPAHSSSSGSNRSSASPNRSGHSSTSITSLGVSAELERLLAETEAEVQRELAYNTAEQQQPQQPLRADNRAISGASGTTRSMSTPRLQPVPERGQESGRGAGVDSQLQTGATSPASRYAQSIRPVVKHSSSSGGNISLSGAGSRPGSSSTRPGSRGGLGSPAAVKLAAAGLQPFTHQGHIVRGWSEALQRTLAASRSSSSGSSNGSTAGSLAQRLQQQRLELDQQHAAAPAEPNPSTPSSLLTDTSTNTLSSGTGPIGSARLHATYGPAKDAEEVIDELQAAAGRNLPADAEAGGSSTCSLYEPVLLAVPVATAAATAGPGVDMPTQPSRSCSQRSTNSHPSSGSLSFGAADNLQNPAERGSPMIGAQSRGNVRDSKMFATNDSASNSDDEQPLGECLVGRAGAGRSSSRVSSRRGNRLGGASPALRQSSSATSEELEQLLQQLASYEAHLMTEDSITAAAIKNAAPQMTAASEDGDITASHGSSLSWSQTLAGLANPVLSKK